MKDKVKQIAFGVLAIIIAGIFIYLWFLVTLWAIAFMVTIIAVALIVYGFFRLKLYFKRKSSQKNIDVERKRGYIEEQNDFNN